MKTIDIAIKDLIRSMRSSFLIGMALFAPILVTGLMYAAFSGRMSRDTVEMPDVTVGVVNADTLPADTMLEAPLGDNIRSMFFDESVQSWIVAADYPDAASARDAVNSQEIGVAVIIPENFTSDYFAGNSETSITILQDPTLSIGPNVVRDMVTSLLDGVAGGGIAYQVISERMEASGQPIDPAQVPVLLESYTNWYIDFQRAMFHTPERAALVTHTPATDGETANALQTMMGLVMAGQMIFFSFFTGSYAMMSILQEAEEGTLARLFTTPTNRTAILMGKFLAVLLTVTFQGLVLMLVAHFAFGVNWGEPASAALGLIGQMLASVGLAVLLVSFIKTSKQAGPIFGGALTGLGMLSGLFTTNIAMPESFNALGNFTPQGWVLKAWKLSLAGQPASEMIIPVLVLAAMSVVMFIIGAAMFRKRFA